MTKPGYSETLFPALTTQLALSLSIPMIFLAALPFGTELATLASLLGGALVLGVVNVLSPKIEVTERLTVGRISVPLAALGQVHALSSEEFRKLIGPAANPKAQLKIRGDLKRAVKIDVVDENDPTPYLIISTRKPEQLVAAIDANRP